MQSDRIITSIVISTVIIFGLLWLLHNQQSDGIIVIDLRSNINTTPVDDLLISIASIELRSSEHGWRTVSGFSEPISLEDLRGGNENTPRLTDTKSNEDNYDRMRIKLAGVTAINGALEIPAEIPTDAVEFPIQLSTDQRSRYRIDITLINDESIQKIEQESYQYTPHLRIEMYRQWEGGMSLINRTEISQQANGSTQYGPPTDKEAAVDVGSMSSTSTDPRTEVID